MKQKNQRQRDAETTFHNAYQEGIEALEARDAAMKIAGWNQWGGGFITRDKTKIKAAQQAIAWADNKHLIFRIAVRELFEAYGLDTSHCIQ